MLQRDEINVVLKFHIRFKSGKDPVLEMYHPTQHTTIRRPVVDAVLLPPHKKKANN
ncbi:hypothetical protein [uncultured Methanomethylovorans sp.]|uniref:hypothetical protein n=1 Tax=uncultured Methanomethylovorans sp. TaxID=183759 RepID=UPI002AA5FB2D|nr:hypothetical protein [uncultured Methanomethylovorans sp.]